MKLSPGNEIMLASLAAFFVSRKKFLVALSHPTAQPTSRCKQSKPLMNDHELIRYGRGLLLINLS